MVDLRPTLYKNWSFLWLHLITGTAQEYSQPALPGLTIYSAAAFPIIISI